MTSDGNNTKEAMLKAAAAGDSPNIESETDSKLTEDDTTQALLKAAWALLIDSLSPEAGVELKVLEQVRATDVVRRANLSTGAFYARWPDRETFVQAMLDFSLKENRQSSFGNTFQTTSDALQDNPTLRELIMIGGTADFMNMVSDKAFAVQVHLWSICEARPDIRERLKALYDTFADQWIVFYRAALDHWGLEARPPFTVEQADTIFSGLVEGLTMQKIVGRDVPEDLFANSLLALIPLITRPVGDQRSLSDMWDEYETGESIDPSSAFEVQSLVAALREERAKLQAALKQMNQLERALVRRLERHRAHREGK